MHQVSSGAWARKHGLENPCRASPALLRSASSNSASLEMGFSFLQCYVKTVSTRQVVGYAQTVSCI